MLSRWSETRFGSLVRAVTGNVQNRGGAAMNPIVVGAIAVWLTAVFLLGAAGAYVEPPGTAPLPILAAATVPLLVFLAAYWASTAFHEWVLAIDLPLAAAIQAWRAGGLGFLALYAHGVLPGVFAWPAGLGDIAIGVTAPWVAIALSRRPDFATSRVFAIWNLLGILDLVVAVGAGAVSSLLASGAPGEVTTAPMAQLPLVLIPAFLVPIFVMLHLAALFQAQHHSAQRSAGASWSERSRFGQTNR